MQCALCKEIIDDDAFYCDMCGEEVKVCLACKEPGKGKRCTSCGDALITLKSQPEPLHSSEKVKEAREKTSEIPCEAPSSTAVPKLRLLNKNINIDMSIDDNSIIGRTDGQYVATFGRYNQISRRHCRFNYDSNKGWCVTDLGSSNKTKYNNQELTANIPHAMSNQTFLRIANIEFYVLISPS